MRYSSSRTNVIWWRIGFFTVFSSLVLAAVIAIGSVAPTTGIGTDSQGSEPAPEVPAPDSNVPDVPSQATGSGPEEPVAASNALDVTASTSVSASSATRMGADDGFFPDVLSPYEVGHPAIANLDPDLREALQLAAADAEADGVPMVVTSGWRSARYQEHLLSEAVVTYGSIEEARRWVNTPEESTHVTGEAVDIGYTDANYWMIEHGSDYGLCQTYANETWHFELAVEPGTPCPPPLTDALETPSELMRGYPLPRRARSG